MIKKAIKMLVDKIEYLTISKKDAELKFWTLFLKDLKKWYLGELPLLFGEQSPKDTDKIKDYSLKDNAILTWLNIHQKTKYLEDLMLPSNAFQNMKVLDIGSGPMPSALAFDNCELYCLDPLLEDYKKIGYSTDYFNNVKFICSKSENIPVDDGFFDAVISVNAIDHVDDFCKTALEVKRVLKPNGKLRMHVHYHLKTRTEPIRINDDIMNDVYGWCPNFKKINESKNKRGFALGDNNEIYTVWSN
jgi:ubiquinone/menaquinone biosynthesis C-methylase UbiE